MSIASTSRPRTKRACRIPNSPTPTQGRSWTSIGDFSTRSTDFDKAIAARGRPAVTVVFSDHGSWIGTRERGSHVRLRNLLAVRGTGVPVSVESEMTLVNLMPSLFEQIFDEPWQRQPDTGYIPGPRDIFDLYPIEDPGSN